MEDECEEDKSESESGYSITPYTAQCCLPSVPQLKYASTSIRSTVRIEH
jgi:hypothetical protein